MMADQRPVYGAQDMRNDNGDSSQVLILVVPTIKKLEEQFVALQATNLSFSQDVVAHSGVRIFVHTLQ